MAAKKFEDALKSVNGLDPKRKNDEAEGKAFDLVYKGVIACKTDGSILDTCSREEMIKVMAICVKRGTDKKMMKTRAISTLGLLVVRDKWQIAVINNDELLQKMKVFCAENTDILERLAPPPAPEPEAAPAAAPSQPAAPGDAGVAAVAPGEVPSDHPGDAPQPDVTEISIDKFDYLSHTRLAMKIMQEFEWVFPETFTGPQLDQASKGFMEFHDGVYALTTKEGMKRLNDDPESAFQEFNEHWPGVVNFCISMYLSHGRKSYRSRIKFALAKLIELSPAFKAAMSQRDTMPIEQFQYLLEVIPDAPEPERDLERRRTQSFFEAEEVEKKKELPKPTVMWIDYKTAAYVSSPLNADDRIRFQTYHDDAEARDYVPPDYWKNYVTENADDDDSRVAVVILNKSHMRQVQEIRDFCRMSGNKQPTFIVVTRAQATEFYPYGIESKFVTKDWGQASKLAAEAVTRYLEDFIAS